MVSILEKGGGTFKGIKLLLCENPLPPIQEAVVAAQAEVPQNNYYTEPYSEPLRQLISERLGVPDRLVHINAGSELILRQLFDRFGQRVHLLTPTYPLFPEIAQQYTETRLPAEDNFAFDLEDLGLPERTTLAVIVNPNNPTGGTFDMSPLPGLLTRQPDTWFLVDEAFIGLAGESVAHLVPRYPNLIVTRTFSKAHSLAGFREGTLSSLRGWPTTSTAATTHIHWLVLARPRHWPHYSTRIRSGTGQPSCAAGPSSSPASCRRLAFAPFQPRRTFSSRISPPTAPPSWPKGCGNGAFLSNR